MKAVFGLGNPGQRYRHTRHNVGFMALDRFVENNADAFGRATLLNFFHGAWKNEKKTRHALVARGRVGGDTIMLAKPLTYMNLSGTAVSSVVRYEKLRLEDILVVCDDADLELGALRLKKSGSSGGHNGLESIINNLRTEDFARLRIGVGRDPGAADLAEYLLRPLEKDKARFLEEALNKAAAAIYAWGAEGSDAAMSAFNRKP